jgi:hypothetical protein
MEFPSRISLAISLTALVAEQFIWLWRYLYFKAVGPSFHGRGASVSDDIANDNLKTALSELAKQLSGDQCEANPETDESGEGEDGNPSTEQGVFREDDYIQGCGMGTPGTQGKDELSALQQQLQYEKGAR